MDQAEIKMEIKEHIDLAIKRNLLLGLMSHTNTHTHTKS